MATSTGIAGFLGASMEAFEKLRSMLADPRLSIDHTAIRHDTHAMNLELLQARSTVKTSRFAFFREKTDGRSEFMLSVQARIEASAPNDAGHERPVSICFGLPAFLPMPGGGGSADLRFDASTGRDYIVRFIDDGTARVDALSTAAHEGLDFVPGESPGPAHWAVLADLTDTLIAWTRDGNPAALVENWALPTDDSEFAKALGELIAEARLVITNLMRGTWAASTIAAFSARLDLYFDQRGRPVEEIPPVDLEWRFDEWSRKPSPPLFNTQKFSVSVAVERDRYSTRLVLRPQIPDILVEGDVHQRFRRWLLADESIAPLLDKAASRLARPASDLRRAWDAALEAEGLAVIRIGQHLSGRNRGDADMLLLDLNLADRTIRLALEARLTLPADDSPIQEHWVRLRALHDGSRWQTIEVDDSLIATWAARLFRTLLSIQALRMGNPFVPGEG